MKLYFENITEPKWTGELQEVLEEVEEGIFEFKSVINGRKLKGEWWRLFNQEDETIGYGWVDISEGDFEISLVVKREFRGNYKIRAGKFILSKLEAVAKEKSLQSTCVVIKSTNPNKYSLVKWFYKQGYGEEKGVLEDLLRYARDFPSGVDITLHKMITM
ncbi:hypothetical protein COI42_23380 [Priestia aryabhattai]|nr:hypothetical protein COI42_23380 [Priestia aryabhattai]